MRRFYPVLGEFVVKLVDVSGRSQETTLFGHRHQMPIAIAHTGSAGLMWYEGEIALARAAAAAGIPYTLATGSLTVPKRGETIHRTETR